MTLAARAQTGDEDLVTLACSVPHEFLLRTWRGWRADRGAQLSYIPLEPNFVGSGLPHVGPWDYVEDVPMLWYGPGFVPAGQSVKRPVTLAGIAPTVAKLLHFDGFKAIDGQPMNEAVEDTDATPKLVVTMVWDAGGMNVLDEWPDAHPYLDSLIEKGTWFQDASVGSSPTSTAQDHATIGTGAFPNHNGITGHHLIIGDRLTSPWNEGPAFLIEPTLADVYDLAMDNEPVVGIVGTVDIHFGMLGHGSFFTGGDRDIALTRSVIGGETLTDEGFEWNLPPREAAYYKLPKYANDVPGFEEDVRKVDQADGKLDGLWRDNNIDQLLKGFDTPARTPYQERVIETVIQNEKFGKDDVPDLLYLNFKEIDYVSHVWSMNSLEMRDAVVAQDLALKRFVSFLNGQVGKGNWATGAHRRPRRHARSRGQRRLPDRDAADPGGHQRALRHGRRRHARRRPRAAVAGVPERRRARAERLHGGRCRALRDDAHPGADRGAHPDRRSGDRERSGLPSGVPVRADAGPALSARSRRIAGPAEGPAGRMSPAWR